MEGRKEGAGSEARGAAALKSAEGAGESGARAERSLWGRRRRPQREPVGVVEPLGKLRSVWVGIPRKPTILCQPPPQHSAVAL